MSTQSSLSLSVLLGQAYTHHAIKCLLCSLAGLAGLPARLLCWPCLAVLAVMACLPAAGLPGGLHQHTHIDTSFSIQHLLDTFVLYIVFLYNFRLNIFLLQRIVIIYNSTRAILWQQIVVLPTVFHLLIHAHEPFFSIWTVLDTFFLYTFFLYNLFYTRIFYTTRLFLYNLIRSIFWSRTAASPGVFVQLRLVFESMALGHAALARFGAGTHDIVTRRSRAHALTLNT